MKGGLGAVLAQDYDGHDLPIAYASRSLTAAERNYPVFELEALGVVWAAKHFRSYLYQTEFTVVTDHAALQFILKKPNPSPRICRWALALQEFTFDVKHRPGSKHRNADALSRLCSSAVETPVNISKEPVSNDIPKSLEQLQTEDSVCSDYRNFILQGKLPESDDNSRRIINTCHQFDVIDGVLCFISKTFDALPVIPHSLKSKILEQFHDSLFCGHLGFKKTYQKIRERFYWNRMYSDIKTHCETCDPCRGRKSPSRKIKTELIPIPVGGPFDRVAMDILGPLPITESGNKYIIIFSDYLTKYVMGAAIPDMSAKTVAKILLNEVILRHGCPAKLHSDQGRNFQSELIAELCKLCSISKTKTSAYHPRCDGLVERFNRTIATMLSMYINNLQSDWDIFLNFVLFAYNTAEQDSTKFSPFYLLYGRKPKLPFEQALIQSKNRMYIDPSDYITEVSKMLTDSWKLAQYHITEAQIVQKIHHDKTATKIIFNVGDWVRVHNPAIKPGSCPKFHSPWKGPFQISSVDFPKVKLKLPDKSETGWINMERLKKENASKKDARTEPDTDPRTSNRSNVNVSNNKTSSHNYNLRTRH